MVLCTFNGERYLGAQLASLAAQRRRPDELIVDDDGSSDATVDVVREFAQRAPFPVLLVANNERVGVAANFSRAISRAGGDIIALCDQDDVWLPTKVGHVEAVLGRDNARAACFSDAEIVDERLRKTGDRLSELTGFSMVEQHRFAVDPVATLLRRSVVMGATLAFRSEMRPLLVPIPSTGLHDVWLSMLLAATVSLEYVPDPLVLYRRHQGNAEGPPRVGRRARLAERRVRGARGDEVAHFEALMNRLEGSHGFHVDRRDLRRLQTKIDHLRARRALPERTLSRVPRVIEELSAGRYHRFSRGWESAIYDVLFGGSNRRTGTDRAVAPLR